jgi:acetyltransferase-like isoleucine patch superfamily enzyme
MKIVVKATVFVVALVLVAPLVIFTRLEEWLSRGEFVFTGCAQLLALMPTRFGGILRAAFYFGTLRRCSWQTNLGFGSLFTHRGATVSQFVSTGAYCVIGHADIGPHTMLASRVSIPSGKRQHFDDDGAIVSEARYDSVRIGAGCWIGEGAILLAAVGARCVVSAGAVVTKEMPGNCIVGGNPAQVLRQPRAVT